jgi:hypothetical protein
MGETPLRLQRTSSTKYGFSAPSQALEPELKKGAFLVQ